MSSRIGFFFFIGISLGAIAGYKLPIWFEIPAWLTVAAWPPATAVIGGVLGIVLAVILDRRDRAKSENGGDNLGVDE